MAMIKMQWKRYEITSFWTNIKLVYILCSICKRSYKDQQYLVTEVPFQQNVKEYCENCGLTPSEIENIAKEYEKNLTRH